MVPETHASIGCVKPLTNDPGIVQRYSRGAGFDEEIFTCNSNIIYNRRNKIILQNIVFLILAKYLNLVINTAVKCIENIVSTYSTR